jgi:protein subunit release factor A
VHRIEDVLAGELDQFIEPLIAEEEAELLRVAPTAG